MTPRLTKKQQDFKTNLLITEAHRARNAKDTSVFCQRCRTTGYCVLQGWTPDIAIPLIDPDNPSRGLKLDDASLFWLCPTCSTRASKTGAG